MSHLIIGLDQLIGKNEWSMKEERITFYELIGDTFDCQGLQKCRIINSWREYMIVSFNRSFIFAIPVFEGLMRDNFVM